MQHSNKICRCEYWRDIPFLFPSDKRIGTVQPAGTKDHLFRQKTVFQEKKHLLRCHLYLLSPRATNWQNTKTFSKLKPNFNKIMLLSLHHYFNNQSCWPVLFYYCIIFKLSGWNKFTEIGSSKFQQHLNKTAGNPLSLFYLSIYLNDSNKLNTTFLKLNIEFDSSFIAIFQ